MFPPDFEALVAKVFFFVCAFWMLCMTRGQFQEGPSLQALLQMPTAVVHAAVQKIQNP